MARSQSPGRYGASSDTGDNGKTAFQTGRCAPYRRGTRCADRTRVGCVPAPTRNANCSCSTCVAQHRRTVIEGALRSGRGERREKARERTGRRRRCGTDSRPASRRPRKPQHDWETLQFAVRQRPIQFGVGERGTEVEETASNRKTYSPPNSGRPYHPRHAWTCHTGLLDTEPVGFASFAALTADPVVSREHDGASADAIRCSGSSAFTRRRVVAAAERSLEN